MTAEVNYSKSKNSAPVITKIVVVLLLPRSKEQQADQDSPTK